MSRILLGAADFEVGKRDQKDTGTLYKLEKARKQVLPKSLQKEHSPAFLDFSLEDPCWTCHPQNSQTINTFMF